MPRPRINDSVLSSTERQQRFQTKRKEEMKELDALVNELIADNDKYSDLKEYLTMLGQWQNLMDDVTDWINEGKPVISE